MIWNAMLYLMGLSVRFKPTSYFCFVSLN